jgi:hypothetical protein
MIDDAVTEQGASCFGFISEKPSASYLGDQLVLCQFHIAIGRKALKDRLPRRGGSDVIRHGRVNLSLERGNCDASCFAYAWLGAIAGARFGDYKGGIPLWSDRL